VTFIGIATAGAATIGIGQTVVHHRRHGGTTIAVHHRPVGMMIAARHRLGGTAMSVGLLPVGTGTETGIETVIGIGIEIETAARIAGRTAALIPGLTVARIGALIVVPTGDPIAGLIVGPTGFRIVLLTGHSRNSHATMRSVAVVFAGPKTAIRFASVPPETAKSAARKDEMKSGAGREGRATFL
jgi:hypothetical protein